MDSNSDDTGSRGLTQNERDSYNVDDLEPVEMDMGNSDIEDAELSCDRTLSQSDQLKNLSDDVENSNSQNENHHDETGRHSNNDHHHHHRIGDRSGVIREASHRGDDKKSIMSYSKIVQVINVAPAATLEQLRALFGLLGDIVNIELYHFDQIPESNIKVCFVEFAKSSSVSMARHLTNTVFIDRALIVSQCQFDQIPTKEATLETIADTKLIPNFDCGVFSHLAQGVGGVQLIATANPRLTAMGQSQYPPLPINTDPMRIEEIRRTVYIGNLDSTIPPDQVLKFFNDIGEVKYIRMAGDDTQPTRFAFVEFTHQSSVANALQHNGLMLGSRALKINHSNNAIVKPQPKIEIDDTSRKVRDRRSTSRDYGSRERHYSSRYDRDYDRRRDRDRDARDRYYDHRRDLSPSRRRSRSRDRDLSSRRRSRSRDRGTRRRSRSPRDSKRRRSRSGERSSKHHKRSRR